MKAGLDETDELGVKKGRVEECGDNRAGPWFKSQPK